MERIGKILSDLLIPVRTGAECQQPATPVCPTCRGAGYLRMDVPFGHSNFGRTLPCTCKVTEARDRKDAALNHHANLQAFADKTFATFDYGVTGVQEVLFQCREYANKPHG